MQTVACERATCAVGEGAFSCITVPGVINISFEVCVADIRLTIAVLLVK